MKHWLLPATITILGLLSVLTLTSIAPELAPRQLIFFLIGFGVFFIFSRIPFTSFLKLGFVGYAVTNSILLLTLALAPITKGSARWIDVGGVFAIQGSQLAIPVVALFLIWYFKDKPLTELKNLLTFLVFTVIPGLLIMAAPDLGTTIVYFLSVGTILFISKTKALHIVPLIAGVVVTLIIAWLFILQPYQKARITSFIAPSDDLAASYNARQSLIAVGSGKLFGRGLGQGVQSHLRFLPERQTDFVFASFAEEFGFIGSILLLSLYLVIILTIFRTAKRSNNKEEVMFCLVIANMTIIQTGVNVGMNVGLLPITGITLPFLSYGGSSVLTLMGIYGIIQSIRINQRVGATIHLK
jgi:rod shape determining protein RodA